MTVVANRIALLRVLRVAGGSVIAGLVIAHLVFALIPAATAAILGMLVYRLSDGATPELFTRALLPLGMFAAALVLGHVAEAAVTPLEFLAKARIDGRHRAEVTRLALAGPSITALEGSEAQTLVAEVSADPKNHVEYTPGDGALSQLRWGIGLVGVLGSCVVVVQYAWWLAPWLLTFTTLVRYIDFRQATALTAKLRLAYREELHADVWRHANVSPAAGKDIRIFGFADWMVGRMQQHIRAGNLPFWSTMERFVYRRWQMLALVVLGLLPPYVAVTASAAEGTTTVATQTAVFAASWALFQALADPVDIHRMVGALQILGALERLKRLLNVPVPAADARSPQVLAAGDRPPLVRFEQVSFRYPGTERTVLDRLNLEIRPGELLAIVGLNGAGKSTLIKLLAGLYEPVAGRITVDGNALTSTDLAGWRDRIAVVFQDFVRYPLSAVDNVRLSRARTSPGPEAIEAAAADAGFQEVLERLPNGWDTPLSRIRTRGVDLSGGQWQQMVLTRAMYAVRCGARLLVLDEPTARLDVRTELAVFRQLAEHRGDTSVVLISHRLSTVRQADRIVLLDGGRITESGTHEELMALRGAYATMFEIQAERFRAGFDSRIEEGELL